MCGGAPSGMPPCFGSARGPQPGQQRGKKRNIGEFRLADLGAGSKRRLLRQVRREYKLQPNECQNLNGGVITTEACCTDQSCAVRPSCASGAQAHVVLTDPERLELWRRAKVFSVTRAPP